jgi:oxygen-independent coproporphyrinogen-3 oxidase
MREDTQQMIQPFPVVLHGHTLKYEIECMLKIFIPATKFTFAYEDGSLLQHAEQGAFLQLKQGKQYTWFFCVVQYQGQKRRCAKKLPRCTPETDKQTCEYQFSRMLFTLLQEITGLEVPWGLLTGIRPVRKVFSIMEETGKSLEAVMERLRTVYLVSPEKLDLLQHTASVQLPLLQQTPQRSVGLYISIPFCPTRCSYCSFVSHSIAQAKHLMPDYIRLLCKELERWGKIVQDLHVTVDTIYFGGGTPTSISASALEQLLQTVTRVFDLSHVREFCVEAGRPDTITREKLEVLKRYGVDRISVNPQTMEDAVLQRIGRQHTAEQIAEAFYLAREIGFDNINMDLIAGLPGDTPAGFHRTLEKVIALDPDSITVHTLTLKRAATLFADSRAQIGNPVREMVQDSIAMLPAHNYQPYYMYRQKNTIDNQENVGYARPGKESYYNMLIMDESQSIFGAGCAASTKIVEPCGRITRIHNYKFPYEYIRQFDQLMEKKQQVYEIYRNIQEA